MISSIHAQWFCIHHSVYTLQLAMTLSRRPNTASEGHVYMHPSGIAMVEVVCNGSTFLS